MFSTSSRETSGLEGKQHLEQRLCYIFRISLKQSYSKNKQTMTTRGQQLRKCIPVGQGHVTKNQPITALVLLGESLGIDRFHVTSSLSKIRN